MIIPKELWLKILELDKREKALNEKENNLKKMEHGLQILHRSLENEKGNIRHYCRKILQIAVNFECINDRYDALLEKQVIKDKNFLDIMHSIDQECMSLNQYSKDLQNCSQQTVIL